MKKICIITPGTIASNPRVVKEATALSEAGYTVHLIYTRHVEYLIKNDQQILDNQPLWIADYIDWASSSLSAKSIKILSGLKKRIADLILKKKSYPSMAASALLSRFFFWQLNKAISAKADLYIAHYPDSIAIASKAAKSNNAKFAFDAEDFHTGEDLPLEVTKAIQIIERTFLPNAAYISASSPLIAKEYHKLYSDVPIITVENKFSSSRQVPFLNLPNYPFKFFWFSQTIGPNRGLEQIISILGTTNNENIQLTLLGNCDADYKVHLQELWNGTNLNAGLLIFVETVQEDQIFRLAATHHFGLGLELPISLNRNICLTNKIFTYFLSGNFLILSKTKAQEQFLTAYPESGICIDLANPVESAGKLLILFENLKNLNLKRKENYDLGRVKLNFDQEKKILINHVSKLWI